MEAREAHVSSEKSSLFSFLRIKLIDAQFYFIRDCVERRYNSTSLE